MDFTQVVNFAVVCALLFLAVSLTLLATQIMPLLRQLSDTAYSCNSLLRTIEKEVEPTAGELRELLHGVNQLRSITTQQVTEVGTKVEDLTGNVNQMVGSATKESSVMGAGLLAGIKAYFNKDESLAHELAERKKSLSLKKEQKNG